MTERLINNLIAVCVGLLAAAGAHASGKPWWTDWPPFDATDIGVLVAITARVTVLRGARK
jgi:hypothetical protein